MTVCDQAIKNLLNDEYLYTWFRFIESDGLIFPIEQI